MADFYYVSGVKCPLEHRLGYYTVGLNDNQDYEDIIGIFSRSGLRIKNVGSLKNRFLISGDRSLTASALRQEVPFTKVPFITKTYQQTVYFTCVALLEDEVQVENLKLSPSSMEQFLSTYGLHLIEDLGDACRFKVYDPDENRALLVAAEIYEKTGLLTSPRFKRILCEPDKIFDFEKFFSS